MIIGIGCDVTHLDKFINKQNNFINKILTKEEIEEYNLRKGKKKDLYLAGHFSVKESIIKALWNIENLNFLDLKIYYRNDKPYCDYKNYNIFISISHEDNIIFTNCIVYDFNAKMM